MKRSLGILCVLFCLVYVVWSAACSARISLGDDEAADEQPDQLANTDDGANGEDDADINGEDLDTNGDFGTNGGFGSDGEAGTNGPGFDEDPSGAGTNGFGTDGLGTDG